MARTNTVTKATLTTHEGGQAMPQRPEAELRRAVANCLLWEDTFYESGESIAKRIADLTGRVPVAVAAGIAIKAREELGLRHAPLWVARGMARTHKGRLVGDTIAKVIRRADELSEFLALYWKDGKQPLSAQVKRGLAQAFTKFDAYQIAKYNREAKVRLRDVLFLSHAKPKDDAQAEVWKQLVDGALPVPDTWEVALSVGQDKKATWERLLSENRLGAMALIRNLRNMEQAGVSRGAISEAIGRAKTWGILPFQFIAALRAAPSFLSDLEVMMLRSAGETPKLFGSTTLVVDVSGSMDAALSRRGTLNRVDAAAALAILLREVGESVRVFTFSNALLEVPAYRGFALADAIHRSQPHGGTYLGQALTALRDGGITADRTIVVTDEQAHDGTIPAWTKRAYIVNVASYQPALDVTQGWTRVSGFSERIVDWVRAEDSGEW